MTTFVGNYGWVSLFKASAPTCSVSVRPAVDPTTSRFTTASQIETVIDARSRDLGGFAVGQTRLEGRFPKVPGDEAELIPLPE